MLGLATVILWLSYLAPDIVPAGDARFFCAFGLFGALHAASLVTSLRQRVRITLRIAFVALAAVLSVVTILLAMSAVPALSLIPGDSARFFLLLVLASSLGASGYWFLVRWFLLKALRFNGLIVTVGVCVGATVLSWGGAMWIASLPSAWHGGLMRTTPEILTSVLPTVAWWAGFSGSLYWNEERTVTAS
jgi:hypothetical protein